MSNSSSQRAYISKVATITIVITIIIGVVAYLVLSINKGDEPQMGSANGAPALTADGLSDFEAVCNGQGVANAAAYHEDDKPYKVTTFTKSPTNSGPNWTGTSLGFGESYYVDPEQFTDVNVVACARLDAESAIKVRDCEFDVEDNTVVVEQYGGQYQLSFYEANSGQKLADGKTVPANSQSCPAFAPYDSNQLKPRIYADPDEAAFQAAVRAFAQ